MTIRALRELDRRLTIDDVNAMDERQLETQLYMRSLRFDHLNMEQMRKQLCDWLHFGRIQPPTSAQPSQPNRRRAIKRGCSRQSCFICPIVRRSDQMAYWSVLRNGHESHTQMVIAT